MEGDKTKQIKLIKGTHVATNPPLQFAVPQTSLAPVKQAIVILPGYERRSKPASSLSFNLRQDSQNQSSLFGRFPFFSSLISASGDPENHSI